MRTDIKRHQKESAHQVSNVVNLPHEQLIKSKLNDVPFNDTFCTQNLYWRNVFILEIVCRHGEFNVHFVESYLRVKCMINVWLGSVCENISTSSWQQ